MQAGPLATSLTAGNASRLAFDDSMMLSLLPSAAGMRDSESRRRAEFARTNVPPPPIGGALPAAQPVTPATLRRQFAARYRHASSAGRYRRRNRAADPAAGGLIAGSGRSRAGRSSIPSAPRWNFEIPFMTPQGTAMAQFEISRDGARPRGGRGQASLARAIYARCRARRPRACAGDPERRPHVGADVGGAAGDRRCNCGPASRSSARR